MSYVFAYLNMLGVALSYKLCLLVVALAHE